MDNTTSISPRHIQICAESDCLPQFIDSMNPLYETLQYVLLFPDGKLGWSPFRLNGNNFNEHMSQIWYYRNYFLHEDRFMRFGHLAQEYAMDMFSRIQEERLNYII